MPANGRRDLIRRLKVKPASKLTNKRQAFLVRVSLLARVGAAAAAALHCGEFSTSTGSDWFSTRTCGDWFSTCTSSEFEEGKLYIVKSVKLEVFRKRCQLCTDGLMTAVKHSAAPYVMSLVLFGQHFLLYWKRKYFSVTNGAVFKHCYSRHCGSNLGFINFAVLQALNKTTSNHRAVHQSGQASPLYLTLR